MNATKIVSILLLIGSIGLGYYLVSSVKSTIDERALIAEREEAIIEKLMLIREAQIVYQEVNGNYTSDWDKLIDFVENGEYPIIQKKERVVTLSYGADSSIITIDTLEIVAAKERIFKEAYNVNSANNGVFQGFRLKVGDYATQGSGAYTLNQNGKNVTHRYKNSGVITNIQDIFEGSQVTKGDLLMTLVANKFDPNTDISQLPFVPGYDNIKFDIYAAEVDKSGSLVDVIEVKNPKPFDPTRDEENEAKNKQPLRFGSKTDVTTSGNWE
ncbi:MAG: hypothetical protein AAF843_12545 [Bacteroidota bacterium]